MTVVDRPASDGARDGATRAAPASAADPIGPTVTPDGVGFSVYAKRATRARPAAVRRRRRSGTEPADPSRSRHRPDCRLLARPRAGTPRGPALCLRCGRSLGCRRLAAVRPDAGPARPVRPSGGDAAGLPAAGGGRPGRCGDRDEERGRRHERLRLGRRPAARPQLARDGHLRSARPRLHGRPELRARARGSRHVRRFHREDPVPRRPRDHRRRAHAGLRVRSPRGPDRTGQLLGLPARRRSSPRIRPTPAGPDSRPPSTSSATWSRRSTAPVSRSSSTSSTTTPPRSARTDRRSASAALPTTTTTSSTRPAATSTTAGPGTRSTRTTRSSAG